jgi:hypothetical protein
MTVDLGQCSVAKISDADRCRGAGLARREKGAYWQYVTDEQRSQTGWIGSGSVAYFCN